jgi:hypothetical protein
VGGSDGGIVSGAEFERPCGMRGRPDDVLDLGSLRQGVQERRTDRVAGRAFPFEDRQRRPRARHRVAGDLPEFGPAEFDRRAVIGHGTGRRRG